MRLVIVVPPLTRSDWPSLGAEQVAVVARGAGHETRVFYSDLLGLTEPGVADAVAAPGFFSPTYYEGLDVVPFARDLVFAAGRDEREIWSQTGHHPTAPGRFVEQLVKHYLTFIAEAKRITTEAARIILASGPVDMVGFSISSDSQKLPSAAIAKKLRQSGFEGTCLAGGSALDGDMGPAFLECFAEFDAVLQGEIEDTLPSFMHALVVEPNSALNVPGSCLRQSTGIVQGPPPLASSKFTTTPIPDYHDYLEQLRNLSPMENRAIVLHAETSRSCWWGEKHRCLFCGVNSADRPYRQKDAEVAVAHLVKMWDTYSPDSIFLTDSIIPASGMDQFLLRLFHANVERHMRFFYEVKSTISRRTIARLACAGVREVQPGIESFSSRSLQRMSKGATSLQQVNLLKWTRASGIFAQYPLLVGIPGDTREDVEETIRVLDLIPHLESPTQVNRLALLRGSPYWEDPGRYLIYDIRPLEVARCAYRAEEQQLTRLEGIMAYSSATWDDEDYRLAVNVLRSRVESRHLEVNRSLLGYYAEEGAWVVTRRNSAAEVSMEIVVDPSDIAVLANCEEVSSVRSVARRATMDEDRIRRSANSLQERGLLAVERDYMLTLPIPFRCSALVDARWSVTVNGADDISERRW